MGAEKLFQEASVLTEEVVDFVRKCLDEDTRANPENSIILPDGFLSVWSLNVALPGVRRLSDGW